MLSHKSTWMCLPIFPGGWSVDIFWNELLWWPPWSGAWLESPLCKSCGKCDTQPFFLNRHPACGCKRRNLRYIPKRCCQSQWCAKKYFNILVSVFKVIIIQYHEPLEIIVNKCIVTYYYYTRYTYMHCIVAFIGKRNPLVLDQLLFSPAVNGMASSSLLCFDRAMAAPTEADFFLSIIFCSASSDHT